MPQVYSIDGLVPVVHPSAFVHESAVLVGDVIVAARAYIGPCACLRGDFGRIVLTAIEPGRKRIDLPGSIPLSEMKARSK